MKCIACNHELSGRQTKFCSRKCRNTDTNARHQSYADQQRRAKRRRLALIELRGGSCRVCRYKANYAALTFHHRDPAAKLFGIDGRKCSNSTWKALVAEANKCDLLCENCHRELHHPDCTM